MRAAEKHAKQQTIADTLSPRQQTRHCSQKRATRPPVSRLARSVPKRHHTLALHHFVVAELSHQLESKPEQHTTRREQTIPQFGRSTVPELAWQQTYAAHTLLVCGPYQFERAKREQKQHWPRRAQHVRRLIQFGEFRPELEPNRLFKAVHVH